LANKTPKSSIVVLLLYHHRVSGFPAGANGTNGAQLLLHSGHTSDECVELQLLQELHPYEVAHFCPSAIRGGQLIPPFKVKFTHALPKRRHASTKSSEARAILLFAGNQQQQHTRLGN